LGPFSDPERAPAAPGFESRFPLKKSLKSSVHSAIMAKLFPGLAASGGAFPQMCKNLWKNKKHPWNLKKNKILGVK
jgi:hypothetical protein